VALGREEGGGRKKRKKNRREPKPPPVFLEVDFWIYRFAEAVACSRWAIAKRSCWD
jgi:hypothetical protein